jgi:hypothetical protein
LYAILNFQSAEMFSEASFRFRSTKEKPVIELENLRPVSL